MFVLPLQTIDHRYDMIDYDMIINKTHEQKCCTIDCCMDVFYSPRPSLLVPKLNDNSCFVNQDEF